jgi:hypothetical protein
VGELRLAQGVLGADLLAVDTERKAKLVEEPGHSAGADLNPQAVQLGRDLGRRLAGPLQTADGVARVVLQKPLDLPQDSGRFFSVGFRPAPG